MRISCRGFHLEKVEVDDILAHLEDDIEPQNVETLDLSNNELSSTDGLSQFTQLLVLDLSHNSIGTLVNLCSCITCLNVAYNKLESIKGIEHLLHLEVFDISYNLLSDMRGLVRNRTLTDLKLAGNRIATIEMIEGLKELRSLDLRHNLIASVAELRSLSFNVALQSLDLRGNPCTQNVRSRELRITIMHLIPTLEFLDGDKAPPSPKMRQARSSSAPRLLTGSYARTCKAVRQPFSMRSLTVADNLSGQRASATIGDLGNISRLLTLLRHSKQHKVERALHVLRNNCLHALANKDSIRQQNGFPILISLLQHTRPAIIQELAASTLWNCSTVKENKVHLLQDGALEACIDVLNTENDIPTRVHEVVLGLLSSLLEESASLDALRALGGIETLLSLLDSPMGAVQERAIAALAICSENNEANASLIANLEPDALPLLVSFLHPSSSDNLLRHTALVLRNICSSKNDLTPTLIVDRLVALREHPNPAVAEAALQAIQRLAEICPVRRMPLLRRKIRASAHTSPTSSPPRSSTSPYSYSFPHHPPHRLTSPSNVARVAHEQHLSLHDASLLSSVDDTRTSHHDPTTPRPLPSNVDAPGQSSFPATSRHDSPNALTAERRRAALLNRAPSFESGLPHRWMQNLRSHYTRGSTGRGGAFGSPSGPISMPSGEAAATAPHTPRSPPSPPLQHVFTSRPPLSTPVTPTVTWSTQPAVGRSHDGRHQPSTHLYDKSAALLPRKTLSQSGSSAGESGDVAAAQRLEGAQAQAGGQRLSQLPLTQHDNSSDTHTLANQQLGGRRDDAEGEWVWANPGALGVANRGEANTVELLRSVDVQELTAMLSSLRPSRVNSLRSSFTAPCPAATASISEKPPDAVTPGGALDRVPAPLTAATVPEMRVDGPSSDTLPQAQSATPAPPASAADGTHPHKGFLQPTKVASLLADVKVSFTSEETNMLLAFLTAAVPASSSLRE